MRMRRAASVTCGVLVIVATGLRAQVSFEQAMTDLASPDAGYDCARRGC